jgi:nucleoside-diphosphate-sugar epimerase
MKPDHIKDVVAAHRQRSLSHYIFISTNMVYPGGVEDMDITGLQQPVAEDAADIAGADSAPDTYGGSKLKCEALLQRSFKDEFLPYTTLRPPAVVGPGCDDRHERLQRLVSGLPALPSKRSRRPPTVKPGLFRVAHSSDIADAVHRSIVRGTRVHGETFNIACPESVTLQEYASAIGEHVGQVAPTVPDDPSLRNFERQGELDVSKARQLLGFDGTPLSEWMGDTVRWHKQHLS